MKGGNTMAIKRTTLKIDHAKEVITITKAYANRANVIGSEEYKELKQIRQDYPAYKIELRTAEIKKPKETHKGLTIEFMKTHIEKRAEVKLIDDLDVALAELEMVKKFNEGTRTYYTRMREWFLSKYEDYNDVRCPAYIPPEKIADADTDSLTDTAA
jgi:hypothetical protein